MENTGLSPHKELHDPNNLGNIAEIDSYPKPTWMLNESVLDNTWVMARTGYEVEDGHNQKSKTRKLSFAKEVSHNELLTDRINQPLLEDSRNSLLYLNTKGKISRAERTSDILKSACRLILHANELQAIKKLKPIRSLTEISFDHLKDYLLAYKVDRHDFDKYLGIIINRWNSKSDIDWDVLKESTTLTTRQFDSLKDKLIKYLERHHAGFIGGCGYTPQYLNACTVEFDINRDLAPKAELLSKVVFGDFIKRHSG